MSGGCGRSPSRRCCWARPACAGGRGEQAHSRQRRAPAARRDQAVGAAGQHRFRHRRHGRRQAVGAVAVEELKKLGAAIEAIPAMPAYGNNIVARLSGTGKGKMLLIAHMDTVFTKGAAAARPFRIEGGRAYGPGVSDDKAGIVVALSVLKILDELKFKDYARLTLMLNTNEETGSRGSRALIEKLAREHDVTLNLEGGRARRRHHDLAQGLRHHQRRGQGPRLARRRRAGARPQRGDGAGASDAAARQARQRGQGHHHQLHGRQGR